MNRTPKSLIIDLGSGYVKCGPPRQPEPLVMPAALKSTENKSGNPIFHELDPGRNTWVFPFEDGLLPKDTTLVTQLCNLALEQFPELHQHRDNMELMLLVFPQLKPEQITEMSQTLRETLGCLHVDAAIQQVLTWVNWGRKTGLIVDIGYTVTHITPIYRGFLLEEHVLSLITGSFFVSAEIRKLLLHQAEATTTELTPIYSQLANDGKAINNIKQSLCQVHHVQLDKQFSETADFSYQGEQLSLAGLPWQAPEVLFQPTLLGVGDKGLTDGITEVLQRVDTTVRAELASNIVLSGGGSMFTGLKSRLITDLKIQIPHLAVKVYDLEYPMYSSWLGATKM